MCMQYTKRHLQHVVAQIFVRNLPPGVEGHQLKHLFEEAGSASGMFLTPRSCTVQGWADSQHPRSHLSCCIAHHRRRGMSGTRAKASTRCTASESMKMWGMRHITCHAECICHRCRNDVTYTS